MTEQPKNPLHGVTLEQLLTRLVSHMGWQALAQQIDINCFKTDPSIKSSLKFLRKTGGLFIFADGILFTLKAF